MMKNKNKMTRRILTFSIAILTIFALVFTLAACSGEKDTKLSKKLDGENATDFVARAIATNDDYKIRLVAAFRGYDITAEGFDFEADAPQLEPKVDVAKAFLQELSDGIAASKDGVNTDDIKFYDNDDKALFKEFADELDESKLNDLVNHAALKTSYNLKAGRGFPTIILVGIGKFLGLITSIVGDYYILAIFIFAILIEILMLPITIKQQKNSIGMAKLRPQIAKIEKKYAGRTDQVTMKKKNEEIMELQQKSGYSPLSGCLPLILQLVVVGFILYPIIQNPLRYVLGESVEFSNALLYYATAPKAAGGLGFSIESGNVMHLLSMVNKDNISGLSDFILVQNGSDIVTHFQGLKNIPNFTAFGQNLGRTPSITRFDILLIIPVINVAGQWASMFLTKRWNNTGFNTMGGQDDPQSKISMKIMEFLPLVMTVFILFKVPAMIGAYWFFRSLISLLKQFIMHKALPVPKYTEEELKELEKLEKERQKAQKEALKAQPKYRSLHYIDEDDYEELPETKQNNNSSKKLNPSDAPEIKD